MKNRIKVLLSVIFLLIPCTFLDAMEEFIKEWKRSWKYSINLFKELWNNPQEKER